MKRTFYFLLTTVLGFALASCGRCTIAKPVSRRVCPRREEDKTLADGKAAPKVYDNENLPAGATLSVVGTPSANDSEDKTDQQNPKDTNADGKAADRLKRTPRQSRPLTRSKRCN